MSLSHETILNLKRDREALIRRRSHIDQELRLIDALLQGAGEDSGASSGNGSRLIRKGEPGRKREKKLPPGAVGSPFSGLRQKIREALEGSSEGMTCKEVVERMREAGFPDKSEGASTTLNSRVANELYLIAKSEKGERTDDKRYRIVTY